jgi:hypothetical protein
MHIEAMNLSGIGRAKYAVALGLPCTSPGAPWPPRAGRCLSLPARARSRTDGRFPGYTWGQRPLEN